MKSRLFEDKNFFDFFNEKKNFQEKNLFLIFFSDLFKTQIYRPAVPKRTKYRDLDKECQRKNFQVKGTLSSWWRILPLNWTGKGSFWRCYSTTLIFSLRKSCENKGVVLGIQSDCKIFGGIVPQHSHACVLENPGASTFQQSWASWFKLGTVELQKLKEELGNKPKTLNDFV